MRRDWSHNIEYHRDVLLVVPPSCTNALDVGCGEGLLTRELAGSCGDVIGLDLDPQVVNAANEAKLRPSNVTFAVGDVMTYPFQPESFRFLCSVATLHHLPLEPALMRFSELLAPGGTLVVVGLYRAEGFTDVACIAAGFIASQVRRRFHRSHKMNAPMTEPQQTLKNIAEAAERLLPTSHVRRRLYFRYSLVWHKPLQQR